MTEPFVTVAQYDFLPEAETARIHLETEGIRTFLVDAETVSTDWALGNAIGYIKLQVLDSQVNAAMLLVEQMRARRDANANARKQATDKNCCLACGTELSSDEHTCPACGWSYASDGAEIDPDEPPIAEGEGKTEFGVTTSWLDSLRDLKLPLFVILLAPVGAAFVLLVFGFMAWIVNLFSPSW